jgi:hypothetical protein
MKKENNRKYRLKLITHDLALGGLQQVIVNICKTINREVFEPSVLCLRTLGDYVPEIEKLGIPVALLPQKKKGVDYFAFLKVAKILREEKIDIIHTHNTQPFMDGTLGGNWPALKHSFIRTMRACSRTNGDTCSRNGCCLIWWTKS